ncbi:glycosyltransferase family 4 protein [Pelagibacterium lentulum]|nr:glycosyltransferase family 4 protein [Pelagibacterium lentulum]
MSEAAANVTIAIIAPEAYGVHGIARYVQSLLANLGAEHKVVLVAGQKEYDFPVAQNVEIINITRHRGRSGMLLWAFAARGVLSRLSAREGLLIVNMQIPPLLPGLLVQRGDGFVVTAHTTYLGMTGRYGGIDAVKGQWHPLVARVKMALERLILRRATKIIALTNQGRQELIQYKSRASIEILPNGVDTKLFHPRPELKQIYDVLFAGRLERRKGSRAMVKICESLVARCPDIRIAIVGHGEDEGLLRSAFGRWPDNIAMLGKVPFSQMPELYAQSRLYGSASYYEGLPGTCLEAMATGVPPVVWDLPFYDNLVGPQMGVRVAVDDNSRFVEAVSELLANQTLYESMSGAARSLVERAYSWERLADRIISAAVR